MARTVTNKGNGDFVLGLLNSTELQKFFFELKDSIQMQVLNFAFKKAGKIINDTAIQNFEGTKKGKSKTGYADLAKSFKSKALRKNVGMVFGMQSKVGYKYRFLNFGTAGRNYKIKKGMVTGVGFYKQDKKTHFTGAIKPSNFFTNAVASSSDTANNMLSNEIILSLERVVKRFERKAGK